MSKQSTGMVAEAIRSNLDDIHNLQTSAVSLSMADALQEHLINLFGYSEVQAAEVVDDIKAGIDQYNSRRQTIETEPEALANGIRTSLEGYSADESHNILVNTLTSIQMAKNPHMDTANLPEINASIPDDTLINAIAESIDTLPNDSEIENIIESLDPDTIELIDKARDFASEDFRLSAAVELYILQKQGQIKLSEADASEMPPQMLGVLAGAAIDTLHATADLNAGRINLTTWQRVLKYIFGALFLIAFCLFSAAAIIAINFVILDVVSSVFGLGLLSMMLTSLIAIAVNFKICELYDEGFGYLVDKLSTFYDKAITRITSWAKSVRDKIAALINPHKTTDTDEAESNAIAATTVQTETEGYTATELPCAPALA